MKKSDEIKKYLLENPDKLNSDYANTAAMFGTNYEQVRSMARTIRGSHSNTRSRKKESYAISVEFSSTGSSTTLIY